MSTPYLGSLMLVPYTFAPKGFAFCDGQILSIAQNTALFALLGNTYGGDGKSTFALPDLRGRVAAGFSSANSIGAAVGEQSHTLLLNEMAAHTHGAQFSGSNGSGTTPAGSVPAVAPAPNMPYTSGAPNATMGSGALSLTGGSAAHENRSPFLVLNWVIALQGIFPPRS